MHRCLTLCCVLGLLLPGVMSSRASAEAIAAHRITKPKKKRIRKKSRRKRRIRRLRARRGFRQLKSGPGFVVAKASKAWGRRHVLEHLRETFAAYQAAFPTSPAMVVHDLSRRWGGRLWPHKSHRRGTDVDIRMQLSPPSTKYLRATPRTLDVEATWLIISKLLETRNIVYIFVDYRLQRVLYNHAKETGASEELLAAFQYPRGRHRRQGIVRHAKGHADHLHVRFKSTPTPKTVALLLP